jgi:peptidoglycan hydrolase-like protein with peptidoglycan-binding domain
MRNVLRRIAFGVLGTGMVVAMAAGAATATASAAVAAPHQAFQQSLVWPTVMKGAQGNRVRTIQYLLNQSGFAVDVDGKFGSKTESEVKEFQSVNHLKPDGVVRSETWEALILTVKQGAKGYAVKAVQDYLNRAYGASLKVDGDFGTATTKAVIKFQDTYKNKYKLMVDGIVGIATWHALVSERG